MTSARNHYNNRPVVVEVRPEDVASPSNIAPSTPPKAVRFPVRNDPVAGVSRPPSKVEEWSLYHFEMHARTCRQCRDPYQTFLNGGTLCESGYGLAEDVAMHVYHRNGQIYSTRREGQRDVRVEVPRGYDSLLALLKARDRWRRRSQRVVPIISYEPRTLPTYTTAPAVQPVQPEYRYATSYFDGHRSHNLSTRRPQQGHKRQSKVVTGDTDDEYERSRPSSRDGKRTSHYYYREEPRRTGYRVEVREPADRPRYRDRESRYYE